MTTMIQEMGLEDEIIEYYNEGLNIRQVFEKLVNNHPNETMPSQSSIFRFITERKPNIDLQDITTDDIRFIPTKILQMVKRGFSDITGKSINSRDTTRFINTYMKEVKADLQAVSDKVLEREVELKEWRGLFLHSLWCDVINPTFESQYENTTKDTISEVRDKYENLLLEFLRKNSD